MKRRCITLSRPGAGSVALTDLASIAPLARENALACVGADGALPPGLAVEALAWGDAPLHRAGEQATSRDPEDFFCVTTVYT